ncbi:hypothetical protein WJX73_006151 [Symbiochloris irregularis]|uniref:CNNM transmembrane domain-containing protein n=1 Tax=Symbiochloris irregularis TaxID=706552 RepID=A0AAW1NT64_9CHLO
MDCLCVNGSLPLSAGHGGPKESTDAFVLYCVIAALLVLLAGLMSGLTLGLLSLDSVSVEVLKRSGTEQEQKFAQKIEPVLRRPHFLLVTLVLCNAAATEALPLVIDRLADPVTAVLLSIVVVLVFGEIIPQAVCSRYGLAVGAYSAFFVRALMVAVGVIAYPISMLLDSVLGPEHPVIFRRGQLKALIDMHSTAEGMGGNLSADEIAVIRGALDLGHKNARNCMTPLEKVFMLPTDAVLDEQLLSQILASGHSRIPVHRPGQDIVGSILVKELIMIDKADKVKVSTIKMRSLPFLRADTKLYDMLHLFQTGRCHMAVLVEPDQDEQVPFRSSTLVHADQIADMLQIRVEGGVSVDCASESDDTDDMMQPLGIVTIEDVIEELIQAEILDETDRYVDNLRRQRVNAHKLLAALPPHLRKLLQSRHVLPRIGALASLGEHRQVSDALTYVSFSPLASTVHTRAAATPHRRVVTQTQEETDIEERLQQAADILEPLIPSPDRIKADRQHR